MCDHAHCPLRVVPETTKGSVLRNVLANAMHITASVFINDNESGHTDYERWLEELVPFDPGTDPNKGGYLHNRTGEDNADAHHKRQIMGREVVVAITDGKLLFGPFLLRV